MNKFYFDYRFFVEAESKSEAIKLMEKFLPYSTPKIWYTIIRVVKEKK